MAVRFRAAQLLCFSLISSVCLSAPYPEGAPWPVFRGDSKNTARSDVIAEYNQQSPWFFRTEKGIFSTPVVDAEETIYVGSADHHFYALNPDGSVHWSFKTGEIIDSAAALTVRNGQHFVTVPSGDGHLYHLSLAPGYNSAEDRVQWSFDAAPHRHEKDLGYDWFEGNVVAGPDGTLFAGNTNWNYYSLNPDSGDLNWRFPTNNMNWSAGAFDDDGNVYWTSLDLKIRKVNPTTQQTLWSKLTLGFVSASVALGSDGTAYVGSFDNVFYALDGAKGKTKWKFQTTDHIYGSAALGADEHGTTNSIYFTSADGHLYKLSPSGELLWKYEVGDVIRSSPAIGKAPIAEQRDIIYFGAANGKLYAINSDDGSLRWSFNTTQNTNELRDRNDLNASPALGNNGIYLAGEHGYIWHVPYDYPLYHTEDPRVEVASPTLKNGANVHFSTPGGSTLPKSETAVVATSTVINANLVVRHAGERIDAGFHTNPMGGLSAASLLDISPTIEFDVQPSADAHFLHIVPKTFLQPDTDYRINLAGEYMWDGFRIGNIEIGAKHYDNFSDSLRFRTAPALRNSLPLTVEAEKVSGFELRRLAVPYPSMMTSLNQIGFDSYNWIVGTVEIDTPDEKNQGGVIIWAIGGEYNEAGALVPKRDTEFMFPMAGSFQNDAFILENKNLEFEVSGIRVPFKTFQMRGQLKEDMSVLPGATTYAEVSPFSDPVYGPLLAAGGLVNKNLKVIASGAYLTRALPPQTRANIKPENISVSDLSYEKPTLSKPGKIVVSFEQNGQYLAEEHLTSVLIIDDAKSQPVWLNYRLQTKEEVDDAGALRKIELTIPAGTPIPAKPRAIVMTDVFPLHQETLKKASLLENLLSDLITWLKKLLP